MVILPSNAPPAQTRARGRNKRPRPGRSSKNATVVIRASTQAARKWIQVKRKYGKMELKTWVAVDDLTTEEKATHFPESVASVPVAAAATNSDASAGDVIPAPEVAPSIADDIPMETSTAAALAANDPVAAAVAHMDPMLMSFDIATTEALAADTSLLSSVAAIDPSSTLEDFSPPP